MFIGRAFNYSRIYPRNTIINDEEEHEDEYEVRLRFFASFPSSSLSSLSIAK
jgi:hypothetical protein